MIEPDLCGRPATAIVDEPRVGVCDVHAERLATKALTFVFADVNAWSKAPRMIVVPKGARLR